MWCSRSTTITVTAVMHTTHEDHQATVTRTVMATQLRLAAGILHLASIQVHFTLILLLRFSSALILLYNFSNNNLVHLPHTCGIKAAQFTRVVYCNRESIIIAKE